MLDIASLRTLRDALIDEGQTGAHHLPDQSGLTTFYIERSEDYDHARWLVRLSYLYHENVLKRTPAGADEYATIDVESELAELDSQRRHSSRVRTTAPRESGRNGRVNQAVSFIPASHRR